MDGLAETAWTIVRLSGRKRKAEGAVPVDLQIPNKIASNVRMIMEPVSFGMALYEAI
jgi:hypothetical protein